MYGIRMLYTSRAKVRRKLSIRKHLQETRKQKNKNRPQFNSTVLLDFLEQFNVSIDLWLYH